VTKTIVTRFSYLKELEGLGSELGMRKVPQKAQRKDFVGLRRGDLLVLPKMTFGYQSSNTESLGQHVKMQDSSRT